MYEKTQFGWVILIALLIVTMLLVIRIVQARSAAPLDIVWGVLFVVVLLLFHSLTVKVDSEKLTLKFGIGLIKRTFLLEEIEQSRPTENSWWSGWGIRYRPGAVLYNVSGFKAVELSLKNKQRKVLVGSVEPEVLSEIINKRVVNLR